MTVTVRTDRRDEILGHAAKVFAAKGYATATVRDIAEAAGILSGSLYHHFSSKDQMLEEILREYVDVIVAQYRSALDEPDPEGCLAAFFDVAFTHIVRYSDGNIVLQNNWSFLRNTDRYDFVAEALATVRELWSTVLQRGIDSGHFDPELDRDMALGTMLGSISAAVRYPEPLTEAEALDRSARMYRFFLNALRPRHRAM